MKANSSSNKSFRDYSRTAETLLRYPYIGLLLVILGGLSFSILGYEVKTNGPFTYADAPIDQTLHHIARTSSKVLLDAMIFSSFLAREMVIIAVVVLTIFFLYKRFWRDLAMLYLGVAGGSVWWFVLSNIYHRPRPVFPDPIDYLPGPGFPSGHTASAVLLYGFLGYILWPYIKSKNLRALMVAFIVLLILMVGFSRLYVGDHYLTDVLAGYAVGLTWGGFTFTFVEIYFWKHGDEVHRLPEKELVSESGGD